MRNLASIAARLRGGNYDGAMIIKTVWEKTSGDNNDEPEVLRETRRLMVFQARYSGEALTVSMLLNPKMGEAQDLATEFVPQGKKAANWCFSRQAILDFVTEVGDSNPIHRSELPVVPGMLLMDRLKSVLPPDISYFEMKFRRAIFADEFIDVYTSNNNFEIFSGNQLSITGYWK